jgi:hypothetical protein
MKAQPGVSLALQRYYSFQEVIGMQLRLGRRISRLHRAR